VARSTQSPAGTSPGTELNQDSISSTKGHATPSRKEQEAARKRPLVANDRAERRRREREAANAERERARVGMANGEQKYLPIRDRGPQRKYIRDYVDARWSVGELLLQLGEQQLVLVMHGRTLAQPGETVHLSLEAHSAHVFDGDSGRLHGQGRPFLRGDAHGLLPPDAPAQGAGAPRRVPRLKSSVDARRPERAAVEKRRVALHQGRAGLEALAHVGGRVDTADGDHAEACRNSGTDEAQHREGARRERCPAQPPGAGSLDSAGIRREVLA